MKSLSKKCVAIVGPTAAGKSALAIRLARKYNGVIICTDSRQVYKYMNIGTNKATRQERRLLPHYGLDLVTPDQFFSLADFLRYAKHSCEEAWAQERLPFLVGGTGLYVTALLEGFTLDSAPPRPRLRAQLEKLSTPAIAAKLQRMSPSLASTTDLQNRRRLIRAIESLASGASRSKKTKPDFQSLQLGVTMEREKLYQRINQRVDEMITRGLITEVKRLAKRYAWDLPAMSGIGYRQIGQWLRGEIDRASAIELIKRDTRHYAKRQLTWYRTHGDIHWVPSFREADQCIRSFLSS